MQTTIQYLRNEGKVLLTLTTLSGDADLYASQAPSEEATPYHYDLSSYSCGYDVITIPYEFKRPVTVSVHGHPYAEETTYRLEAHFIEVKEVDGFLESEISDEESSALESEQETRRGEGGTVAIIGTILFECLKILADILL